MSDKTTVFAALARLGFEVVKATEQPSKLRVIGRCTKERWPFLLPVIHGLLVASEDVTTPWTCDVSRVYMLHNSGREVRYAWRLLFQGEGLAEQYTDITRVISQAPKPKQVELTSYRLPGYKPGDERASMTARGKGAAPAGSSPLVAATRGGVR